MTDNDPLEQLMWDMEWAEASQIAPSFVRAVISDERWDKDGMPLLEASVFPRLNTLRCPSCTDHRKVASEQFICSLILSLAERAAELEVELEAALASSASFWAQRRDELPS